MSNYKVLLDEGKYSVYADDTLVPSARVKQISFSKFTSHTMHGEVHHVSGPCVAVISVPGLAQDISKIPVTSKK